MKLDNSYWVFVSESIDKLCITFSSKSLYSCALKIFDQYLSEENKNKRVIAIYMMGIMAEGFTNVMTENIDEIFKKILQFKNDLNFEIRFAVLNTMGQFCTDFREKFSKNYSEQLSQLILDLMDDPVESVRRHAFSALINFTENVPPNSILKYSPLFSEKIENILKNENESEPVLNQTLTALAGMANCLGKHFDQFYDKFIPYLLNYIIKKNNSPPSSLFISNPTHSLPFEQCLSETQSRAAECATILFLSCVEQKKEIVIKDANTLASFLLHFPLLPTAPNMDRLIQCWTRIFKTLGTQFTHIMSIIPSFIQMASYFPKINLLNGDQCKLFFFLILFLHIFFFFAHFILHIFFLIFYEFFFYIIFFTFFFMLVNPQISIQTSQLESKGIAIDMLIIVAETLGIKKNKNYMIILINFFFLKKEKNSIRS